jgi:hypothetical protein
MQSDWRVYPDDLKENNARELVATFNEPLYKTATELSQMLICNYHSSYTEIMLLSREVKARQQQTQKPVFSN